MGLGGECLPLFLTLYDLIRTERMICKRYSRCAIPLEANLAETTMSTGEQENCSANAHSTCDFSQA